VCKYFSILSKKSIDRGGVICYKRDPCSDAPAGRQKKSLGSEKKLLTRKAGSGRMQSLSQRRRKEVAWSLKTK
jgi:hypothetical protein